MSGAVLENLIMVFGSRGASLVVRKLDGFNLRYHAGSHGLHKIWYSCYKS
jgi:hypothetical protein